jgi:hypothetical protein
VNDERHGRDDEQDVQGKSGEVEEQKAAYPEKDQNDRQRQPHLRCTLWRVSHPNCAIA